MSFGFFNNNNPVAVVSNGNTIESRFNTAYPKSTNTTGFMLNGVDICNYLTEYAPGFQTANNYGFSVGGININQKFSFSKPVLGIAGGTVSSDANYRYYKFTSSGNNLTITAPNFQGIKDALNTNPIRMRILLVGGGGSGAQTQSGYVLYPGAGGGGAGTFVTIEFDINGSRFNNNIIRLSPTIGAGGGVTSAQNAGNPGQISSLLTELNTTHTVTAGGGGGGYQIHAYAESVRHTTSANGTLAGSSGGATSTTLSAGNSYAPALTTQTGANVVPESSIFTVNAFRNIGGGAGNTTIPVVNGSHFQCTGGGGGGGAGGVGSASPDFWSGGPGGVGKQWIDDNYYAGGGGGANTSGGGVIGQGGLGGGGGVKNGPGDGGAGGYGNGVANTGGGGSGGWAGSVTTGGSGVCIIAIPIASYNQYFV